jgi:hypothetical protein
MRFFHGHLRIGASEKPVPGSDVEAVAEGLTRAAKWISSGAPSRVGGWWMLVEFSAAGAEKTAERRPHTLAGL